MNTRCVAALLMLTSSLAVANSRAADRPLPSASTPALDARTDTIRALKATGPHVSIGPQARLFDRFVGTWDLECDLYAADGQITRFRGEWIFGKEWLNGTSKTRGAYLDAIVHPRFMGPVTAVFRTEKLIWSYLETEERDTPTREKWRGLRQTVGARVRIPGDLTAQFNVLRHSQNVAFDRQTAFDVALTYSIRNNRSKVEKPAY